MKARRGEGNHLVFWCPGCDHPHAITYDVPNGWTWNGDTDRPTINPSVLVHPHDTLIDPDLEGDALTAPENRTTSPRCHSFVTDGTIQFLGDCTHTLAGRTVGLPDWP